MDSAQLKKLFEDHTRDDEARFKEMTEAQNILLGLHAETQKKVETVDQKLDALNSKFDEFFNFIKALGTGKKLMLSVAVLVGALVGIVSGLRYLFGIVK